MLVDWFNFKKSRMYGHNRIPIVTDDSITPAEVFFRLIRKDQRFIRLKGKTKKVTKMDTKTGQYYYAYEKWPSQNTPSDTYCYSVNGRKAIVTIPSDLRLKNRVKLHLLWVPPKLAGKGIATEVMHVLQAHIAHVNEIAEQDKTWNGKGLSHQSLTLSLAANPFIVRDNHWDIDRIENGTCDLDWTCSPHISKAPKDAPDYTMSDESFKPLKQSEARLTLKQLRSFYIDKLGFVECKQLAFITNVNFRAGTQERRVAISPRSLCHQNWPLIWPPENLPIWDSENVVIN